MKHDMWAPQSAFVSFGSSTASGSKDGGMVDGCLELGMCLLAINGVATCYMSYADVITAMKQLPRPLVCSFGVVQQCQGDNQPLGGRAVQ